MYGQHDQNWQELNSLESIHSSHEYEFDLGANQVQRPWVPIMVN